MEDHLLQKHQELAEEAAQKLGELETDFADLKLNGNDGSFSALQTSEDLESKNLIDLDDLCKTSCLKQEDLDNGNIVSE